MRHGTGVLLAFLLVPIMVSCSGEDQKRWVPPKFVKEWEIREIKPGARHRILSMTATEKGLFVLVNATETRYLPPRTPKPVSEMTEKEKKEFIQRYVAGKSLSSSAASKLTGEERDEYIEFIIRYFFPPRQANEMSEADKKIIMNVFERFTLAKEDIQNISLFKKLLQEKPMDWHIDLASNSISKANMELIDHYCIQHYDSDGNFVTQWPDDNRLEIDNKLKDKLKPVVIRRHDGYGDVVEVDSRESLIKPLRMASDYLGNIFVVDYAGGKIVKFDSKGVVLALWWIEKGDEVSSIHRGIAVYKDKLLVMLRGYSKKYHFCPELREYTLEGRLKRRRAMEPPKVPARMPITGARVPFLKEEGNIAGIGVDSAGGIYLFVEGNTVVVLDEVWNKKKEFRTVLKKGFESPGRFYDPDRRREIAYEELMLKDVALSLRKFTSEKLSWIENQPGYYYANDVHVSPKDEVYVSFLGMKPFGVIDAMIFDKTGEMMGYWKHQKKSYGQWFEQLSDIERIEAFDDELSLAFYGNDVFIGRTLHEARGSTKIHHLVQKFTRTEGTR